MRLPFLLLLLTTGLLASLHAESLSLQLLRDPPALTGVKLSPDGTRLSLVTAKDGEQHITVLTLADLKPQPAARLGFSEFVELWWAGDNRLFVNLQNPDYSREFKSVDLKTGKVTTHLVGQYRESNLVHILPEKPDHVLLAMRNASGTGYDLRELDFRTNRLRTVERNPGQVSDWLLNARGEALAAVEMTSDTFSLLWRPTKEARWQRRSFGTPEEPKFDFLAVHPDQQRLLALDQSSDPSRLVALEPETFATETIFAPARFDPGSLDHWAEIGGVPRALLHPGDTLQQKHFTDQAARLQSEIDRALPGKINLIKSISRDHQRLIVLSFNEYMPGQYYLLDRHTGRMMALGSRLSGYSTAGLGRAQAFSFSSSDGLKLYGRLVLPPSSSQPPPVVFMVGNRMFRTRDYPMFDLVEHLYASRGYAVAQIDYRGSKGYGREFAQRGRGQIQRRIPLDLSEAVAWLGGQGWIDPRQAIIMGEFKGGWVAMHTLTQTSVFAGWINYSTGMSHDVRTDLVKPDPTSGDWNAWREEIEIKMSGIESAPSPMSLLPKITVPSFHYYLEWRAGTLFSGGTRVKNFLRRNERDAVMFTSKLSDSATQNRGLFSNVNEQIFAFLAEHFPTEQNPRPQAAAAVR